MSSFSKDDTKKKQRERLQKHIEEFKKKGGKIKKIPPGQTHHPDGITTTQLHITKKETKF